MAAPVGVPFPSGETPATTAAVWAAFAGATGLLLVFVLLASWHSAVEPAMSSGNVFNPHEIEGSDEPITDVSAGMTWLHFEGRPASGLASSPFESSFIEAERSSTTNSSTGARFRSNESKPQLTSSGRSPLNFWSGSPASGSSTTTRPPVPGFPVVVAPSCGRPEAPPEPPTVERFSAAQAPNRATTKGRQATRRGECFMASAPQCRQGHFQVHAR